MVITGSSNAVNLTDGLDGLASGLAGISAAAFATFAYLFGRVDVTSYLNLFYLPGRRRAGGLLRRAHGRRASASSGSTRIRPRSSWATPAAWRSAARSGTVAILLKAEFLLLLIGGVFAAEAV